MNSITSVTSKLLAIMVVSMALSFPSDTTWGLTDEKKFVRTANYYLKAGWSIKSSDFNRLSSYDLLILPMEAASYNRDFFEFARKKNPDIIILAYVPSRSININDLEDGAQIRKRMKQGIRDEWYLREPNGEIIKSWPGTMPLNLTSGWNEYLAHFVNTVVLSTGVWDGVLYDEIDTRFSNFNAGNLDLNRDSIKDTRELIDESWSTGIATLLQKSRELFGPSTIIMTNGSSHPLYQPFVNGRVFENFPTPWEEKGTWIDSMKAYLALPKKVGYNPLFMVNRTTENTGKKDDYRSVRYGLASTLLGDGYYSFDFGDRDHGQLWWYDEFDISLGKPLSLPKRVDMSPSTPDISLGVWQREFQNGVVFVNSLSKSIDLEFEESYEKIRGKQDPIVNNGTVTSSLSLAGKDGILMVRPLNRIPGSFFKNGSFTRIFNSDGSTQRNGFFAYDQQMRGSALIAINDLDHDVREERIVIDRGTVSVFWPSNGNTTSFTPFEKWNGDLNAAFVDTNKDGTQEIIVAPERRNGSMTDPLIKVVNPKTGSTISAFYPFGKKFKSSIRVASADVDGDGMPEIIASSGTGTQPFVRVFNTQGKQVSKQFLAYTARFRGGVFVAAGDTNGDGIAEIITAPGSGSKPHIRMFNSKGKALSPGFFAFNTPQTSGVRITTADLDGDGRYEILPMTMNVFTTSTINK
ncbi:MAG: putative glycoside hydrolase [bacterium]|nr:putative glycoside hydrolase [bacterium]